MQSIAEIVGGGIGFGGGTLLDMTGAGAVAGVPAQVASVGLITHGVVTGANTINNVNNDSILMSTGASVTIGAPPQVDVGKAANLSSGRRKHTFSTVTELAAVTVLDAALQAKANFRLNGLTMK